MVGIVLWPALLVHYFHQCGWRWDRVRLVHLLAISLVPLGVVGYAVFCGVAFGDPLAFLQTQRHWGRAPVGLHSVFSPWAFHIPNHIWEMDQPGFTSTLNTLAAIGGALCLWPVLRIFGPGLSVLTAGLLFMPWLSGQTEAMGRYVSCIFPVFLAGGAILVARPVLSVVVTGVFAALWVTLSVMFSHFWWVT